MFAFLCSLFSRKPAPLQPATEEEAQRYEAAAQRGAKYGAKFWASMQRRGAGTLTALFAAKYIFDNVCGQVTKKYGTDAWDPYLKAFFGGVGPAPAQRAEELDG